VRALSPAALLVCFAACARAGVAPGAPAGDALEVALTEQQSGTTALLQAVSALNDSVVWISGHRATWVRTTDGGRTWMPGAMAGRDSALQFRDVHAASAGAAFLLAAGPGDASRIYHTADGGRSWALQFRNSDTAAFYDCFDFWDASRGVVVSDAVRGRMVIRSTSNGGDTWDEVDGSGIPSALDGEGAFAASGTCLVAGAGGSAWIGTGAATGARVHYTRDYGRTWRVVATPVVSGQASGIAALAFRDRRTGMALGGRIGQARDTANHVALTADGGSSWTLAGRPPLEGAIYGAAWIPGTRGSVVAAGPGGLALTTDGGRTWRRLSENPYWAVGFGTPRSGWASGPRGRITRIEITR
jgi:photosystem II stability/assembly factor-like uncharacterized protein